MTATGRLKSFARAAARVVWTGGFAVVLTGIVSGMWAGLLTLNLRLSPSVPWSAPAMAVMLVVLWTFLRGGWGPRTSRPARRNLLRGSAVRPRVFFWAVVAGLLANIALGGLWIVISQLVKVPGNPVGDFSNYPTFTVVAVLITASVAGAVSEEAGFRGYFQGTLERYLGGPVAIALGALVMMPQHALTQGFAWPTMMFYLIADSMLGFTAFITKSILPGIVVHAAGLLMFFALVWPYDKTRAQVVAHGPDAWFMIHVAQLAFFGILALVAFRSLTRVAGDASETSRIGAATSGTPLSRPAIAPAS